MKYNKFKCEKKLMEAYNDGRWLSWTKYTSHYKTKTHKLE